MPCELRQSFASAEGDRLVEIDIVGSQMFYLLTLLENVIAHPEKYATPIVDQDIVEKRNRAKAMGEWLKYNKTYKASESRRTVEQRGIQDQEQAEGGQDQSGDPRDGGEYTIVQSLKVLKQSTDFAQFASDILSGQIYEQWQAHRGFVTRHEAKIDIFEILYGGAYTKALLFNELYPTTGRLIEALKAVHGYWFIGRTLQRLESNRIIQGVCGVLSRDHPDWPGSPVTTPWPCRRSTSTPSRS